MMKMQEAINKLENVNRDNENKVFTMYLNTDPSEPDQNGDEWKIHLKNGLRNFEAYLEESGDKEELQNFKKVKEMVNGFVQENETKLLKGIILFATADQEVWFAERVQMRLDNEFFWESQPMLHQFKNLQERFPKSGIILVQQNEIRILSSHLNEIENEVYYELNIDTEEWRQKQGPATTADTQKDKFDSRYNANKQRWYKQIAPKLDKLAKDEDWKKIYVVGESDPANEIIDQMNKPVDQMIQKNILDLEASKVLEEVFFT